MDEDIEHGEHVTIDTSRESALFRGVQEERKGATGEHHASARPVEPRPPDDEQSEEERGDENLFCAQASSYHQQERPNEGTSNKIAMQRGGEVAPEDLGYTLSD